MRRRAERHLGHQHLRRSDERCVLEDQRRRPDRIAVFHDQRHLDRRDRAGHGQAGGYANAIVALDPKSLAVKDWFTQPGVDSRPRPSCSRRAAGTSWPPRPRDGRVLLLDAASLGGADHATPLFASPPLTNGRAAFAAQSPATLAGGCASSGRTGGVRRCALAGDSRDRSALSSTSPTTNGTFALQPGWVSENMRPRSHQSSSTVWCSRAGANAPAKLYALNGTTGRTMWQSGDTMSAPCFGPEFLDRSGHVFVGTGDGTVYAFGFDMERGTPTQRANWR